MSKKIEIIDSNITNNRRFSARKKYVITAEVHVRKNVTLTIEDGTTILILNGLVTSSTIRRAALIFDQGSGLRARRVYIKACNRDFKQEKIANNAGIWLLGSHQPASKDTMSVKIRRKSRRSSFKADLIAIYYLGRAAPLNYTNHEVDVSDDIDGLSVLGVGPGEWSVSEIRSFYSADDGIDLTNAHISLDRLKVVYPVEDGINLSSSHLTIKRSLNLDIKSTTGNDRDLVDFETDNGASFLEIQAGCQVELNGVFGDELDLVSKEMPRPITRSDNERLYKFKGQLTRAALIYSLDKD